MNTLQDTITVERIGAQVGTVVGSGYSTLIQEEGFIVTVGDTKVWLTPKQAGRCYVNSRTR